MSDSNNEPGLYPFELACFIFSAIDLIWLEMLYTEDGVVLCTGDWEMKTLQEGFH